jgi:hypothetical protein
VVGSLALLDFIELSPEPWGKEDGGSIGTRLMGFSSGGDPVLYDKLKVRSHFGFECNGYDLCQMGVPRELNFPLGLKQLHD